MDHHVLAQAQERPQNWQSHTRIIETKLMMRPQNPSRDHHSEARKFLWEDYPREVSRLTHARTHYRDEETTMVEAMITEATDTILLTTMGMDEDTAEIVETVGATTVETEEKVEMVVETTLTPRSKRRSTTSRKGQNVTRTSIPNTRTSGTGTHSSLK
jgi:hypothetical protein